MARSEFSIKRLHESLTTDALRHALGVLAEATEATVTLFDSTGQCLVGPVPGNAFIDTIMSTDTGSLAVLALHRAAIGADLAGRWHDPETLLGDIFPDQFAIPIARNGQQAGVITLGNRPRQSISDQQLTSLEIEFGLNPGDLRAAAAALAPWDEHQAGAARNMASLLGELFADLCAAEQSLNQRMDELSAVYNIASLLAGTQDLQEVLTKTTQMVCDVMNVKACSIRLLDESTGQLKIRAVHNLSEAYLGKGDVTVGENPIDAAALSGEMVQIANAPEDVRTRYPEQARQEGIVSGLVAGLIYRGKGVGVLRVYTGEPHTFSSFEQALLRAVASQAAAAIINARLLAEAVAGERYARQIEHAGTVQRRMIPSQPPDHKYLDLGAVYSPHFNVGGDFFDFITLPKGNLGVAIADVSGKGVPASLLMASLRAALRVHAHFTYDIDDIMWRLNRHVCKDTTFGEFATAIYGTITPDGRRFTYCNAGHLPALHLRDGKITELDAGGLVLGINLDEKYEKGLVEMNPDDVILLYTDGATEALNFEDEQFGADRLKESLVRHADQPASRIVKNIRWDVRRFRGLADRMDDLTLVAIKVL